MIPQEVLQFRKAYESNIGKYYSGWVHGAFTLCVFLGVMVICIAKIETVFSEEWLTVPIVFCIGNLTEYVVHRYPLHHPMGMLAPLFRIHTLQHHQYYTDQAMEFESSRDVNMVLFPPFVIIFFAVIFIPVVWLVLNFLVSANVAYLSCATATFYFLCYEVFHFSHHCPDASWIAKVPIIARARRVHRFHHNKRFMSLYNFNITFPFSDWVFKTEKFELPRGSSS